MSKSYVVDSSFLLSWLLPDEKIQDKYKKVIIEFKKHTAVFISCELLKYEIGNCLKSAVLQKRINFKKATEVFQAFEEMYIEYQDLNKKDVLKTSVDKNLSFYDASYLYLAKKNKCKLLTLDKTLSKMLE